MLAQEWFYGLMTRPDMSIKVERKLHDMRILGQDCGSTKYGTIRKASFDLNIMSLLYPKIRVKAIVFFYG